MQSLYHPEAHFSDPVFTSLNSAEVKAMWQMLVTAGKDLKITFQDIKADDKRGSCSLGSVVYVFTHRQEGAQYNRGVIRIQRRPYSEAQ